MQNFKNYLKSITKKSGDHYSNGTVNVYAARAERVFNDVQSALGLNPVSIYSIGNAKYIDTTLTLVSNLSELDYKNRNGINGIKHYINFLNQGCEQ